MHDAAERILVQLVLSDIYRYTEVTTTTTTTTMTTTAAAADDDGATTTTTTTSNGVCLADVVA